MNFKLTQTLAGSCAQALLACTALLGMGTAHAASCALVPSGQATLEDTQRADLLREFKFAELDNEIGRLHKKNIASDGTDLLTLRNLVSLQQMSGQEENLVRMWADERPQSFFAQLNAGIFYANRAFGARGVGAASQVSGGQWTQARALGGKALPYLQKAMALDPKSALPQSAMMGLAVLDGKSSERSPEQWLQAANQTDPKNLAARINAVNYLSPRWGGSFELLDHMVEQAGKSLSVAGSHYLRYNVVLAKASHNEVIEKDKAKAQAFYKQARSMCDNSEAAREGMTRTYQ